MAKMACLKRFWRRWLLIGILAVLLLWLVSSAALAVIILRYGAVDRARAADVIIVLGGGQSGTTRRTNHAVALYYQGIAPYVLCTGGAAGGEGMAEAERCAWIAARSGIPAEVIIVESTSLSTEENAIQSAAVMREHGWHSAVLVSDDFHLWRAHWLFDRQNILTWTSPVPYNGGFPSRWQKIAAVGREIAATEWTFGKTVLGLPYTHVEISLPRDPFLGIQ